MEVFKCSIALLIILASLIYWYLKRSFSYWKLKGVPHKKPVIPYGNVKDFSKSQSFANFMQTYYMRFKGTSKICGIYLFTRPIAMALDLDLIKNILVKEFSSFSDRGFYYNEEDDPLSGHLVALDGIKWKNTRVKLTPTFTSGKMKYMFPTIANVGDRLTNYLRDAFKNGDDELEMKSILSRFTMDVIGTCAFGIECNTLKDIDNEFYRIARMAMEKSRHNRVVVFLLNDMKRLARFFHMKTIQDEVTHFFMNVVKTTIEYRERTDIQRNDFMDLLIKLKIDNNGGDVTKGLTLNQIAAQSFLFFLAGYETSSTTMLFALYELALNQEIQTKLRQDIQNALKKYGDFTYEMMMDIPYLDQTINETLRKYPPFTALRRVAQTNYAIPGTNIVIDKGTAITIPVYGIHHDPEIYPDPETFDPNRFSPEEIQKRHSMAWLAFGEGPRNCIALRFGMMQTRIGLITLLTNFKFAPCSKTPVPVIFANSPIVLSPKDSIYLKYEQLKTEQAT